jgi:dTMP kinase
MFISFEGVEGAGKSTQISKIAAWFQSHGFEVVVTKEPGGTSLGESIRKMLLDPHTQIEDNNTELLLFFADRLEHVQQVIKPALCAGKVVLCDRYIDSTWAYQQGGRQLNKPLLHCLSELITIMPDITFLLDIHPLEGLKRARNRGKLDRFEQSEINFHMRVRHTYCQRAHQFPDRIKVIDVMSKSVEDIFTSMTTMIMPLMRMKFSNSNQSVSEESNDN